MLDRDKGYRGMCYWMLWYRPLHCYRHQPYHRSGLKFMLWKISHFSVSAEIAYSTTAYLMMMSVCQTFKHLLL